LASEDGLALHRAFEAAQERLYREFPEAQVERRPGCVLFVCPTLPMPQCNGPWVVDDGAASGALADAIAEVEAAGAVAWVQTRSGQDKTRQAARGLGFTHEESAPGMLLRRGELVEPAPVELEIGPIRDDEVDGATAVLAEAFGAPKELFDYFCSRIRMVEEACWYVGRAEGTIVSTAIGHTHDGATGIFNVATPPPHRGRGYGAALTARAARDGFAAGAELAYLQSSEIGHGVYQLLGFRDVEEYTLLARPVASA